MEYMDLPPANVSLARYCFGGAMAARLGSTDTVNTIVVAHPAKLTADQLRAIKVTLPRSIVRLKVSPTPLFRSLLLGCWPKVNHNQFHFSTASSFIIPMQRTTPSRIKMSRLPRPYSRRRRRSPITLSTNSELGKVKFSFWWPGLVRV